MKRIAMVSYDLRSGGSQRAASELTMAFKDKYEFYYIVFDADEISYKINAKLIDLNYHSSKNKAKKVLNTFLRARGIDKTVKKFNIDTVMAFTPIANRALRFSGVKCRKIAACRGYEHLALATSEYHACCDKGCEILFNSDESLQYYLKKYPQDRKKCKTIQNLIDCTKIKEKSALDLPEEVKKFYETHRTVSNVGIFSRHKGHWNLLKSFEILKERVPDAGLVLIGHDGAIEEDIKKMVSENKYADDILLIGYSDNPFMYVAKSDVYALSSTSEGFPNALAEAMCLRKVCVATLCKTGPLELLTDSTQNTELTDYAVLENGIATPVMDEKPDFDYSNKNESHIIFASALERALTDTKLRKALSVNAEKRALKLDKSNIMKEYESYLDR